MKIHERILVDFVYEDLIFNGIPIYKIFSAPVVIVCDVVQNGENFRAENFNASKSISINIIMGEYYFTTPIQFMISPKWKEIPVHIMSNDYKDVAEYELSVFSVESCNFVVRKITKLDPFTSTLLWLDELEITEIYIHGRPY